MSKMALDDHAAEPTVYRHRNRRPLALRPPQFHAIAFRLRQAAPNHGYAPPGNRKGAEFLGVDRELMQRQAERLSRLRLEQHGRALDHGPMELGVQQPLKLQADQFAQGSTMPAFLDQD